MKRTVMYAGSFDPLTNGHLDILHRGSAAFDHVILAVANNPNKKHLFTLPERLEMARDCAHDLTNVSFDSFDGLLVDFARVRGAKVLLRGLRALSDFDYEYQLASMNRKLAPDIETVFMMTSDENACLSSRLVKEVASFGGRVDGLVPAPVWKMLHERVGTGGKA